MKNFSAVAVICMVLLAGCTYSCPTEDLRPERLYTQSVTARVSDCYPYDGIKVNVWFSRFAEECPAVYENGTLYAYVYDTSLRIVLQGSWEIGENEINKSQDLQTCGLYEGDLYLSNGELDLNSFSHIELVFYGDNNRVYYDSRPLTEGQSLC